MTFENDYSERVNLYLPCLLLGIVAATFFSRIWDPDFFWHLATGRWIVENMALPECDPFTPFFYGTDREALVLKGYWLAQVCYHYFYSLFGTFGITLLKSVTFVALFGSVIYYHQSRKTPFPWIAMALLPLYETLLFFRADRPNMFSLLFFALLLYLLETRRWKWLTLLMLVWANAHGGYLLGDIVIVLYVGVLALGQRHDVSWQVVSWALAAVAASFVNPNGITPIIVMIKSEGSAYQQTVSELLSPLRIALEFHEYFFGYYLVLLLAAGALFFCRRSVFWPQLAVLLLTALISLEHIRYMPFFVIACAFFLPLLYRQIALPVLWERCLLYGSISLILILFVVDFTKGEPLSAELKPGIFPEKATDFVLHSGVNGRIFSSDVWGGYLLWRLPQSTILSDGRALSEEVDLNNYEITRAGANWDKKLLDLDTKIIVLSAFNPFTGKENKLWQALNFHPDWQLVYADDVALVYFRQDVGTAVQKMSQEEKRSKSVDQALAQKQYFIKKDSKVPWHWADLGHIQVVRGDIPAAVQAYRQALDLDPANEDYRARVNILELREKKDRR